MSFYCLFDAETRSVLCVDPKCGCTTIKDWFARIVGNQAGGDFTIDRYMRPAAEVGKAREWTRIWFLRDPLRRLVSFYYHFVVDDPRLWSFADHASTMHLANSTFADFVEMVGDLHSRGDRLQHHLQPQTRNLERGHVDHMVKIEDLTERADALMRLLGTQARPSHLNRRAQAEAPRAEGAWLRPPGELRDLPRFSYDSFWNANLHEIAHTVYAEDFKLYETL